MKDVRSTLPGHLALLEKKLDEIKELLQQGSPISGIYTDADPNLLHALDDLGYTFCFRSDASYHHVCIEGNHWRFLPMGIDARRRVPKEEFLDIARKRPLK